MEVTLSSSDVRGLLSSCDRGDILQLWWVDSSLIVFIGFFLIVAWASSQIQEEFGGSSLIAGASSGGSLWGGCSLYSLFWGS